jgi:hypothetical protein
VISVDSVATNSVVDSVASNSVVDSVASYSFMGLVVSNSNVDSVASNADVASSGSMVRADVVDVDIGSDGHWDISIGIVFFNLLM